MAGKKVRLRVITPEEIKVDMQADMAIIRCTSGDMGVLPGHEARSATLGDGVLRVFNGDEEQKIAVFGGLAEIRDDVLTVLTNNAERPEDIDRARAEADRERMERFLRESTDDLEIQSSQIRLRRSLVRIEVSAYPLVSTAKPTGQEEKPK